MRALPRHKIHSNPCMKKKLIRIENFEDKNPKN
jgi:hypothetical protein